MQFLIFRLQCFFLSNYYCNIIIEQPFCLCKAATDSANSIAVRSDRRIFSIRARVSRSPSTYLPSIVSLPNSLCARTRLSPEMIISLPSWQVNVMFCRRPFASMSAASALISSSSKYFLGCSGLGCNSIHLLVYFVNFVFSIQRFGHISSLDFKLI